MRGVPTHASREWILLEAWRSLLTNCNPIPTCKRVVLYPGARFLRSPVFQTNTLSTRTTHANTDGAATTRDERLRQARVLLERGLDGIQQDPGTLAAYLRFRAHFRSYSPQNTMLIMLQRPSARYCMGFKAWLDHGRCVRKGEKGLMIYAPVLRRPTDDEVREKQLDPDTDRVVATFKIAYVFDITQTDVLPGKEETALQYVSPIPELGGDDFARLYDDLVKVAGRLGFTVERFSDRLEEGYCSFTRRVIGVRADHAPNDAAAVLAHELAHAVAHEGRKDLSPAAAELQAEGAAYLLCYSLGLDTSKSTLPYLKHFEDRGEESLSEHLAAIDQIVVELIDITNDLHP